MHGFSYTYNIANFEVFRWNILLSANLLFMKSAMEYNGLMSFLSVDSGINSIIFKSIYIYVALCLFKIWYPQLSRIIFKLSDIILDFFEEQEANRLERENDMLRERIKENERQAYEDWKGLLTENSVFKHLLFVYYSFFVYIFQ